MRDSASRAHWLPRGTVLSALEEHFCSFSFRKSLAVTCFFLCAVQRVFHVSWRLGSRSFAVCLSHWKFREPPLPLEMSLSYCCCSFQSTGSELSCAASRATTSGLALLSCLWVLEDSSLPWSPACPVRITIVLDTGRVAWPLPPVPFGVKVPSPCHSPWQGGSPVCTLALRAELRPSCLTGYRVCLQASPGSVWTARDSAKLKSRFT